MGFFQSPIKNLFSYLVCKERKMYTHAHMCVSLWYIHAPCVHHIEKKENVDRQKIIKDEMKYI